MTTPLKPGPLTKATQHPQDLREAVDRIVRPLVYGAANGLPAEAYISQKVSEILALFAERETALREAAKVALLVLAHLPDSYVESMNVNARKDLVFATDALRAALSQGEAG